MLPDGEHEVRFPQPGAAVEKERVVGFAGVVRDGAASGGNKFIGGADDEVVEGVAWVKAVGEGALFGEFLGDDFDMRSPLGEGLRRVRSRAADKADFAGPFEDHKGCRTERGHVVILDPITIDVVWDAECEVFRGKFDEAGFLEPAVENVGRYCRAKLFSNADPYRAKLVCYYVVIHRGDELCFNGW